jgi:hypothetical protein
MSEEKASIEEACSWLSWAFLLFLDPIFAEANCKPLEPAGVYLPCVVL